MKRAVWICGLMLLAAAAGTAAGGAAPLLGAFALLILLPFVPGLIEVAWPRDRYPLPIDLDYHKDPRYLGRSARALMDAALADHEGDVGRLSVKLSREEQVDVADRIEIPAGARVETLLVARGVLEIGEDAACERDAFARAGARVGARAALRALACDGPAVLGDGVRITRWLDVEGDVAVGAGAVLGAHAAASGAMTLADGVAFSRLYAETVHTAAWSGPRELPEPPPPFALPDVEEIRDLEDTATLHRGDLTVGPGETHDRPLVVHGDLTVAAGAKLGRTVKAYGAITLADGALLLGDAFAEGRIVVGAGASVRGNIFTQDVVELRRGTRVGAPGVRKSVVGKKGVVLGDDVAVHGYVLTDGQGRVSCRDSS